MQPVLVNGGEFAAQALVEIIDDFGVALHGARSGFLRPNRPESLFRMLLNQFRSKGNRRGKKAVGIAEQAGFGDFQQAASANSCAGSSFAASACGQPEQQALAQGPRASSMMVLMVRAQRPHSALQPRQP